MQARDRPLVSPAELIIDALAVFRLAVFISDDAFPPMASLREKILARWPSDDTLFLPDQVEQSDGRWINTEGNVMVPIEDGYFTAYEPFAWSKLISCVWCLSIWLAVLPVAGRSWFPSVWGIIALVLALSATAGLLNLLRTGR